MEPKEPLATSALPDIHQKGKGDAATTRPGGDKYDATASSQAFLVLVVDDSIDNVVVLSLALQGEGYRVVTASNGKEAVSVAALTQPNIILMDISMPLLDGLAATRQIRENEALRDVPVIAITAFSTDGFRRAAYDVGIAGYLVKPIDFQRMYELIRRLLAPKEPKNPPDSSELMK
jgi:CheY-like chemotaxis protein